MSDFTETIQPTPLQAQVLAAPENYDIFLGGGRGGGKTFAVLLLILRHVESHGRDARALVARKDFPAMRDFEDEARSLLSKAYGKRISFNAQHHIFRFPNGATLQLDQIENHADFQKYQGKSFSLIAIDEAGQYNDPALIDLLRSSLRSKADVPCRMILAANPGGPGHGWIHMRHIANVKPWEPYTEGKTKRTFITVPSTLQDNPHLDAEYSNQIEAATANDPELQKAWLYGDWNIARGAYFGAVYDTQRNNVTPWPHLPNAGDHLAPWQRRCIEKNAKSLGTKPRTAWSYFVAGDHGSAAPAVFYLVARSPGAYGPDGRFYPSGSLILFDEIAFHERNSLSKGLELTVPTMAGQVVAACRDWSMRATGVLDDACFAKHGHSEGTLASEYRKAGFIAHPAMKGDRISGWQIMRRLLADAGEPDKPGLYVSERCEYWLATVPFLDRDPRRPEDVDTTQADHAADACRYGCLYEQPVMKEVKLTGF